MWNYKRNNSIIVYFSRLGGSRRLVVVYIYVRNDYATHFKIVLLRHAKTTIILFVLHSLVYSSEIHIYKVSVKFKLNNSQDHIISSIHQLYIPAYLEYSSPCIIKPNHVYACTCYLFFAKSLTACPLITLHMCFA